MERCLTNPREYVHPLLQSVWDWSGKGILEHNREKIILWIQMFHAKMNSRFSLSNINVVTDLKHVWQSLLFWITTPCGLVYYDCFRAYTDPSCILSNKLQCCKNLVTHFNPLTPNDHYSGRTAPLTSKRCILYIYSTNTGTEYFKHGISPPFFSSSKCSLFHNSNVFGSCFIHILYTECAKI